MAKKKPKSEEVKLLEKQVEFLRQNNELLKLIANNTGSSKVQIQSIQQDPPPGGSGGGSGGGGGGGWDDK